MVLHWPKSLSDRCFVHFLSLAMMMSSSPAVNSSPSRTLCPLHSHGMHPNCGSAYRVGLRCVHPPRHCNCTCYYSTCGPECGGEDSHPRVCQRPVTCGTGVVSRGPQEALRGDRARDRRSKDPQRGRQITRRERRNGLLSATTSRDRGWLGDQVFAWLARSNAQVSGGSVLAPEHRHHGETL